MNTEIPEQSAVGSTAHRFSENRQPKTVGHLAGEVCLAVHSHQALRLIWGRRRTAQKPPISGLMAFASAVNTIWQAAEGGDPYALWWLIKIEAGIEECRAHLNDQFDQAGYLYPDSEILSVDTAESEQPYRMRLAFSNPYAYRAAYMLGEYDVLVRTCHTLTFVGAGEPAELLTMVALAGHHVRHVFAIPQRFKVCAIDRDDMRQNNQRAQRAAQLMGPLPEEILNSETLPVFVPTGARHAPDTGSTTISENAQPKDCEGADEARCNPEDEIPS